jgi:hypothetical protein
MCPETEERRAREVNGFDIQKIAHSKNSISAWEKT